jgi:hypothetical protein
MRLMCLFGKFERNVDIFVGFAGEFVAPLGVSPPLRKHNLRLVTGDCFLDHSSLLGRSHRAHLAKRKRPQLWAGP